MARPRILSRREDLHCVTFHVVLMLAYAGAFWLYRHPDWIHAEGPWSRAAFVLAAAMVLGWCSGINVGVNFHNHAHRPVFRSDWLNRWFGRSWTVSGGWPSFFWEHAHVTVHHDHLLGPGDWTLPRRRPDGSFESPYLYSVATWPWRYAPQLWRDFRNARGGPHVPRKAAKEFAIFLVLWSIPFWIDWRMALGLWLLPQWLANAAVMGPGMYAQHADCEMKSPFKPYGHSNTFVSRFFNLTMFNIGYHIEHHDHPQVHWSALPALHAKLKDALIEGGGHVVPMGYYRAGHLLCVGEFSAEARARFRAQHPDYRRSDVRPAPGDPRPGTRRSAVPRTRTPSPAR